MMNTWISFSFHNYQAELFPNPHAGACARAGFVYSWSRFVRSSPVLRRVLLKNFGVPGVFAFIAVAMAIVAIAIGAFGPRTNHRPLEEISH